jgi:class 3 adenylate cyclase
MYHPQDLPKVKANLLSFKETGTIKYTEFKVITKDNNFIEVSLKFTPVYDSEGKIAYSNAVWRDITEIKRIQAALQQEKDKSEKLLLNILPEAVAKELQETNQATPQNYDQVSILFTDFKGFTQLSERLTPAELLYKLDHCFLAFDEICERHHLEKIKTIGDAYMAAGGIPHANTTNAINAVNAAIEMQAFINDWKAKSEALGEPAWEMRAGINTGKVMAGVVGKKRFAYDIWGDAVNIAARMESSGAVGKLNISASTYVLVKDVFECQYRGKVQAKGKGEIDMYFVMGEK